MNSDSELGREAGGRHEDAGADTQGSKVNVDGADRQSLARRRVGRPGQGAGHHCIASRLTQRRKEGII